jgi:hypothetical protein
MCEPRHLTTLWVSTAYYRDSFTFTFFYLSYTESKFLYNHSYDGDGGDYDDYNEQVYVVYS